MERHLLDEATGLLERVNDGLISTVWSNVDAERLLDAYIRIEKLAAFGKATLSARVSDPTRLAHASGTSVQQARRTIEAGRTMASTPRLAEAVRSAEVSIDKAAEIAAAAAVAPAAVDGLVALARTETLGVVKEKARNVRLEAEERVDLAVRQHRARRVRHWVGELGMIHLQADLEPHVGGPLVNRLEDQARRLARANPEDSFDRHLADALPALVSAPPKRAARPELVVLVSHEVAKRGWRDVGSGEHCTIPGIGPIAPERAREIAQDAFLTGVFFDGTDLRHFKRWTRSIPAPVKIALCLGEPPDFDGVRCVDCGNRFRIELDHDEPHAAGGPASVRNIKPRCAPCHARKTADDHRSGRLTSIRNDAEPSSGRDP